MGDGCGAHMVIRHNTFLSPGQVGIGIACGTDIHITDNIIYGEMRPLSNVGIYIWNQYTGDHGIIIAMSTFGASAPAEVNMEKFGFTSNNVIAHARKLL